MAKVTPIFLPHLTHNVYATTPHCINNENVREVYFAVNDDAVSISNARDEVRKIKVRLNELIEETSQDSQAFREEYQKTSDYIPKLHLVETRIIKILFAQPDLSIKRIRSIFSNSRKLIVDISGCNKKVSTDVIYSFMSNGIKKIRYFELDSRAYNQKPQDRIYHKIYGEGLPYYDYIDFSEPGTSTLKSFNRMRFQGDVIKSLLIFAFLLAVSVIILIQQQRTSLAQLASVLISVATVISLILGILNSGFDVFDRFKQI